MFNFLLLLLSLVSVRGPAGEGISVKKKAVGEPVAHVDTVYVDHDSRDSYEINGTENDGMTRWWCGTNNNGYPNNPYMSFAITSTIYNATIDSVKLNFKIYGHTGSWFSPKLYGIQQENCNVIEGEDFSEWEQTTVSVVITAPSATGWYCSNDIKTVFSEWVDDYSHSDTDYFGIVLDENGVATGNFFSAYEFQNGSNYPYLIFYYTTTG